MHSSQEAVAAALLLQLAKRLLAGTYISRLPRLPNFNELPVQIIPNASTPHQVWLQQQQAKVKYGRVSHWARLCDVHHVTNERAKRDVFAGVDNCDALSNVCPQEGDCGLKLLMMHTKQTVSRV